MQNDLKKQEELTLENDKQLANIAMLKNKKKKAK
jgi:hypothetical protein